MLVGEVRIPGNLRDATTAGDKSWLRIRWSRTEGAIALLWRPWRGT